MPSRRKRTRAILLALNLLWLVNSVTCAQAADVKGEWTTCAPEEVGLDSAALVEMFDFARERQVPVHSVQIVRHGRLALDAYFHPYQVEMRHDIASVTKSVTSTLVGLAINQGVLPDVHQTVIDQFPRRTIANLDARKRALKLEDLLTMRAGWDCGVDMKDPRVNVDGRLAEMRRTSDWVQYALDLPMVTEPGARFAYCNANCHLLSAMLTQAAGTNELALARRELFEPLGIRDAAWPSDPRGNNYGWSDLQLHPRDMAKLGQLFLQRGRWGDRQIVPEAWLSAATSAHVEETGNGDHYGYYWWVPGEKFPGVFEAIGRGGQRITVWPARDLVLVFTGGGFDPGDLAPFILKAIKSDQPAPANPAAYHQLQERIAAAAKAPTPRAVEAPPAVAARVSGKTFKFSPNGLELSALTFAFEAATEAKAELRWAAERVRIPIGLDAVPRFSLNPIVNLPQAATGQWLNDTTFRLDLDLVGGINFYRLELNFSGAGRKVIVSVNERTGLNSENFIGVRSD